MSEMQEGRNEKGDDQKRRKEGTNEVQRVTVWTKERGKSDLSLGRRPPTVSLCLQAWCQYSNSPQMDFSSADADSC